MKKMNKLFLFGITFLAFVLASCKIGLGEALDLEGPDVEIISPTMRQSVRENFTIIGTAYDNNDVKKLTVTVDDNEWKNEGKVWTFKAKGSSSYVPYDDATWEIDADKKVKWQIRNVNITSGRHLITVVAVDGEGNTSANSQKVITVFFDNNPPEVTITTPNIKHKDFVGENGIKTMYSALTDYRQLQIVNNVLTGGFTISGVTKDDSTVNYVRLFVKKVDEDSGEAVDFIEKNLVLTDSGETFVDPISQDTLRSWEVEITDADLASLDGSKHYLQIATQASDNAGNADAGIDVHGYVILWKDADHPWLTVNLSSDEGEKTQVYSGASCQGTAFDNVQVQKVLLTIKSKNGTEWQSLSDFDNKEIPIQVDAEDVTQTSNFKFNYPSDVGDYQIILKAVDMNGKESESVFGYVEVQDMSFPSVRVEPITNPFGDAAGNITLNVTALDDTEVEFVKYRICLDSNDKAKYSDKNAAEWDAVTAGTNNPTWIEGNIETDNAGYVRKKYNLSYTLNLFNDLKVAMSGTDTRKLEQTTFIFLVQDKERSGKSNRSITKFVLPADVNPPTISLTNIGGVTLNADGSIKNGNSLPAFSQNFVITGKWGDDSFNAWKSTIDDMTTNTNKVPKIEVMVRDKSEPVTMNKDGNWSATVPVEDIQDSGSAVGAIDIKCSITDIGGSTTVFQKGYQIDTDTPKLEYTSCDLPSGTYPANTVLTINLHFNREVTVKGTPTLTLNNGQTATYNSTSGKVVKFTYKVATGDDTNALKITNASLNGGNIKAKDRDLYYEGIADDLGSSGKDENKTMGKAINILTSTPTYNTHSWNDTDKKLTIVFNGNVTAKSGTIEIEQDDTTASPLLVPAYLTKDEYNSMPSNVQSYYEEGTLGASATFVPDLTTKYILKYNTNTDDSTLKERYKATGAHKRSVNILSENVTAPSYDSTAKTTTFVLTFGALPCKGASYTFTIPAGLVKNAAGTVNAAKTGNAITNVTGIEEPVIRIYKPQQEIKNASNSSSGTVTHPLSTTFRIDCRTPNANLKYFYDCLVADVCEVTNAGLSWGGSGEGNTQEEWHVQYKYNNTTYTTNKTGANKGGKPTIQPNKNTTYSKGSESDLIAYTKNQKIDIGKSNNADIEYTKGLTYQITATVDGSTVKAHEVAYRTTLVLKNFNTNGRYNLLKVNRSFWNWTNNNAALFLRGGEKTEGANATSGLPCSWNINEKGKIVMMKSTGDDYYFTTWNITVDKFYWQPVGGLCDGNTNTASGNEGPAKSIFLQDQLMFRIPDFPIGKGEYMTFTGSGERFDFDVPGKVMNHR